MSWQRVCKMSEVPKGEMRRFTINGTGVVIYHLDSGFHATQASCTHMFAPLGRGKIVDGCYVQCPLHRARFDIRTGEVAEWANFPPGVQLLNAVRKEKALQTFAVKTRDGDIYIQI